MTDLENKKNTGYGSKMKEAKQKSLLLSTKELKEKQMIDSQKEIKNDEPQRSDHFLNNNKVDLNANGDISNRSSNQFDQSNREAGKKVSEHIQIPIAKFEFLENEIGVTEQDKSALLERSNKKKIVRDFRHTQSSSTLGDKSPKQAHQSPKRPFKSKLSPTKFQIAKDVTVSGQNELVQEDSNKQNDDLNVRQSSVAKLVMYPGVIDSSYRAGETTSRRGDPSTVGELRSKAMSPYENQLNQASFDDRSKENINARGVQQYANGLQTDKGVGIAVRDSLTEGPKINFVTSVTLKRKIQAKNIARGDVQATNQRVQDQTVGNLLANYDQVRSEEKQFLTSQLLRDQASKFQISRDSKRGVSVDQAGMQEYAQFLENHQNIRMKYDENEKTGQIFNNSMHSLTLDETKRENEYQQKRKLRLLDAAQAKIEHVLRQRASQSQTQKHQRRVEHSTLVKDLPVTNPLRSQILAGSALSSLPEFDIKAAFDPFSQKRLRDRQYIKDRQLKSKSNMDQQVKMSNFYGKYHEKMDHGFVKERIKNLQYTLEVARNTKKSLQVPQKANSEVRKSQKSQKIPQKQKNLPQSNINLQMQDSDTFIRNELKNIQQQDSCSSPLIERHGYNLRQRIGLGDATIDQFLPKILHQTSNQFSSQQTVANEAHQNLSPQSPMKVLAQEFQLNKHDMSVDNTLLESTPMTNTQQNHQNQASPQKEAQQQSLNENLYLKSRESLYKVGRTQHKKSNETLQGSGALRSGRESVFDRMEPVNDYSQFQRFNLQENSDELLFQKNGNKVDNDIGRNVAGNALGIDENGETNGEDQDNSTQPKPIKVRVSSRTSNQRPKLSKKRLSGGVGRALSGQDNYNSSNEDSDTGQSNRIKPIGEMQKNVVGRLAMQSELVSDSHKIDQNQLKELNSDQNVINNYGDVQSNVGGVGGSKGGEGTTNYQFKNLKSLPSTRAGRQVTTPDTSCKTNNQQSKVKKDVVDSINANERTNSFSRDQNSPGLIRPAFAQQIIPVKRVSIKNYDSDSSPILQQDRQHQQSEMAIRQHQDQQSSQMLSLQNSLYSTTKKEERYRILTPRTQAKVRDIKAQVRNREIRLKMLSKRRITDVQKQPPSDGQKGPFARLLDPRRTSMRYKDEQNSSSVNQSALDYALEDDPARRQQPTHTKGSKSVTALPIDYAEIQYQQFQNFDLIIDAERHLQKIIPTGKQISVGKKLLTPRKPNKQNSFYHSSLPQEARLNIDHLKLSNIQMKPYNSIQEPNQKKGQEYMQKQIQEYNKKSDKNRININEDITSVEFVMRLSKNLKLTEDFEKAADLTQQHFLSKKTNRRSKSIADNDDIDELSRFGKRKNYSPLKELTQLVSYNDKVSLVNAKSKKIKRSVNPGHNQNPDNNIYGDKESESKQDLRKIRKSLGNLQTQKIEKDSQNDKTDVSYRSTLIDQNEEAELLINDQGQLLISNRTQQKRDIQHNRYNSQSIPVAQPNQQIFVDSNEEPTLNFGFGKDSHILNLPVVQSHQQEQDQIFTADGKPLHREMVHSQYKPFLQHGGNNNVELIKASQNQIQTAGQNSANPSGLQSWRKMDQSSFNSGSRWRISQPVFFKYPEVAQNEKNNQKALNSTFKTSEMGYVIDDKMTQGSRSLGRKRQNSHSIEDYLIKKKSLGPIIQKRKQNAAIIKERQQISFDLEDKTSKQNNFKKFPNRMQRIEKEYSKYTAETKRKALIERETRNALRNCNEVKNGGNSQGKLVVKKELYFPNVNSSGQMQQNDGEAPDIAENGAVQERLTVNLDIHPERILQQKAKGNLTRNSTDKNYIYLKDEQLPSTRNVNQMRNQNIKSASEIGEEQIGQQAQFETNFKPYNTNAQQMLYGESAQKIQKQLAASTGSGSWKSPFQQHLEQTLAQKQNRKNRQNLQQLASNPKQGSQNPNLTNDHGLSVDSGSVNKYHHHPLDSVQILNQDFLMLDAENPTIPQNSSNYTQQQYLQQQYQHYQISGPDSRGKQSSQLHHHSSSMNNNSFQQQNRAISTAQNSNQMQGDFPPPSSANQRQTQDTVATRQLNHLNHSQMITVKQRDLINGQVEVEYGQQNRQEQNVKKKNVQGATVDPNDSFAKFGQTFGIDNQSKQDSGRNHQDQQFVQKVHNSQLVEYITVQDAKSSNQTPNLTNQNSKIFQMQKPLDLQQNLQHNSTESIKIADLPSQQPPQTSLENQKVQLSQNNLWSSQQDINMLQITGQKMNQSVTSSWDSTNNKNGGNGSIRNDSGFVAHLPKQLLQSKQTAQQSSHKKLNQHNSHQRSGGSLEGGPDQSKTEKHSSSLQKLKVSGSGANQFIQIRQNASQNLEMKQKSNQLHSNAADVVINVRKSFKGKQQ